MCWFPGSRGYYLTPLLLSYTYKVFNRCIVPHPAGALCWKGLPASFYSELQSLSPRGCPCGLKWTEEHLVSTERMESLSPEVLE